MQASWDMNMHSWWSCKGPQASMQRPCRARGQDLTAATCANLLQRACAVQMLSGWEDVQQPRLVTGTMQHAPEVGVQRNHLPCGHAVEEASLGDLFEEVRRFRMHSSMNSSAVVEGGGWGVSWRSALA